MVLELHDNTYFSILPLLKVPIEYQKKVKAMVNLMGGQLNTGLRDCLNSNAKILESYTNQTLDFEDYETIKLPLNHEISHEAFQGAQKLLESKSLVLPRNETYTLNLAPLLIRGFVYGNPMRSILLRYDG